MSYPTGTKIVKGIKQGDTVTVTCPFCRRPHYHPLRDTWEKDYIEASCRNGYYVVTISRAGGYSGSPSKNLFRALSK
jgi:hypothetical protein